jgi:uncharacterized repeat protein (TIGR01451 family)
VRGPLIVIAIGLLAALVGVAARLDAPRTDLPLTFSVPPAIAGTSLGCGSTVAGEISAAGEVDDYTFAAPAGALVALTLVDVTKLDPDFTARMALFEPSSASRFSGQAGQVEVTVNEGGIYLLRVSELLNNDRGSYAINLACLRPAFDNVSISCGETLSDSLTTAGDTDVFTFAAAPGSFVALTLVDVTKVDPSFTARMALFEPSGAERFSGQANQFELTLNEGGTYVVKVSDVAHNDRGTYAVNLACLRPASDHTVLNCPTVVTDDIEADADTDVFTLDAMAGTVVTLTLYELFALEVEFNPGLAIFSPTGVQLSSGGPGQRQLTVTTSGTYVIKVFDNTHLDRGGYAIACRAPATGPDVALIKTENIDPVPFGVPLTYTLHALNIGNSPATDVIVTDTLPPELNGPVSVSASAGSCADVTPPTIQCSLGTIVAGGARTITIRGGITCSGAFANTAGLTATGDVDAANNDDIETTSCRYRVSGIVCEFTVTCGALRGATVTLNPTGLTTLTSISDGSFEFTNVPNGGYWLTVSPACTGFGCYPATAAIVDGADAFVTIHPCVSTDGDLLCDVLEQVNCQLEGIDDAAGDPDTDDLTNAVEFNMATDPCDADTDRDGCADSEEIALNPLFGGDRNPLWVWDFFDVTGDSRIDLGDTLDVLAHFGDAPGAATYDIRYDRYAPTTKLYRTDRAYTNEGIDLSDALLSLASFGHACDAPP